MMNAFPPASTKAPVIVAAVGGNALQQRGRPPSRESQAAAAATAAASLAALAAATPARVVITHGNGPQVGALAAALPDAPLDELDAATEGALGVVLACALDAALAAAGVAAPPTTAVVTRVVVDGDDPGFRHPTKPVGGVLSAAAAAAATAAGVPLVHEPAGPRRAVASPAPLDILELPAVRALVDAGVPVIACGGGGVPVVARGGGGGGRWAGAAAVVDKDAASSLLAVRLGAAALLLLTDAPCVYDPDRWPDDKVPVPSPLTVAAARALVARLPAGSMAPKVAAAADFVEATGGRAAIGELSAAAKMMRGEAGTLIEGTSMIDSK
jgi:carbamate kinase